MLQVSKDFLLYGSGVQRLPSQRQHLLLATHLARESSLPAPFLGSLFSSFPETFTLGKEYGEEEENKRTNGSSSPFTPYCGGSGSFLVPALGSKQHRRL